MDPPAVKGGRGFLATLENFVPDGGSAHVSEVGVPNSDYGRAVWYDMPLGRKFLLAYLQGPNVHDYSISTSRFRFWIHHHSPESSGGKIA